MINRNTDEGTALSAPSPFLPTDPALDHLSAEARERGYRFVDGMISRWHSGETRFDHAGERLLCIRADDLVVAIAGLTIDPYLQDPDVGRLRHLYVLGAFRRRGLGAQLIETLTAAPHPFTRIRLRAGDAVAAAYYDHLGWQRTDEEDATHVLI